MKNRILNVLVACEESQAETIAFRALGHRAFSCDIQPCRKSGAADWHICGDVTPYLAGKTRFFTQAGREVKVPRWDLVIAHPPCTYLCRISAAQMYHDRDTEIFHNGRKCTVNAERYAKMLEGERFFMQCYNANAPYVAVENPVPLQIAELPPVSFYTCPSFFGAPYTKKTCYWVRNLPPLMAEITNGMATSLVGSTRGKYRSRTAPQLALAMAKQWSEFILRDTNL